MAPGAQVSRGLAAAVLLALALVACGGRVVLPIGLVPAAVPSEDMPASLTPFQPVEDTATLVPAATLQPSSTATQLPPSNLTDLPAAAPVEARTRYTLNARLDYAAHSLRVDEQIAYQNSTSEALPSLVLAVEADRWLGCFSLGAVSVISQAVTSARMNGIRLEVPLAAPLPPGSHLDLSIRYALRLPQADIHHVFGYNAVQADLVDWYPFVVPYVSGRGWLLHPPAQFGEHLVYPSADYDVSLQLSGADQTAVFAASGPGARTGSGWHYHLERARAFAFSASPDYRTSSLKVGSVTLTSYYFEAERAAGEAVLQAVAQALATYTDRFGAFPYPGLSIVEALFDDGLECDGLFFLSRHFYTTYDGTPLNYLIDIGVHETAHQWWFGLVGDDQALEPWLDEALATYSEEIFYEANYPAADWWSFRVDAFDPSGWVDTDIYHAAGLRPYINAVYLRGARFLQAVRERVGDEAFFAFLKDYAARMGVKIATADDFFRILRQGSGADISDLQLAYFQVQH